MADVTTAEVTKIPECDICIGEGYATPHLAKYDGKTSYGPWAYMCEEHFARDGRGLGLGLGQELVLVIE